MTYDELYHYGIPGMKWGKRKARPININIGFGRRGSSSSTSSRKPSRDYKRAQSKSVKYMSDEELRTALNRKTLEQNLARQRRSVGRAFVEDVVLTASKTAATNLATKYAISGGDKLIQMGITNIKRIKVN